MITLIVFSKDRALQCDSLLRSVQDHCTGVRVVVLAKASSALHVAAYRKLLGEGKCDELTVNGEGGGLPLGEDIFRAVEGSENTALAVDDQLFYEPSDFIRAAKILDTGGGFVWSWRLGFKPGVCERDYAFGVSRPGAADGHHWNTSAISSDPDYGYLFHSDGALYRTENYLAKLTRCLPDWRTGDYTPNDLEGRVAARKKIWAPLTGPHLGPLEPTCITWQLNLARRDYPSGSPAFELPETGLDALATAYLAGKRVDNEKLYAALRENPLRFNQPGDRPTHVRACEEASRFWAGCVR